MNRLSPLFNWTKRHIAPVLLFATLLINELMYRSFAAYSDEQVVSGALRISLIIMLSFLLVFQNAGERYRAFKVLATGLTFAAAVGALCLFIVNPLLADQIAYEDELVENLSAIFLIGSSLLFLICSLALVLKRHFLTAMWAFILCLIFFVIGMEEISWMQRILDVESNKFFMQNNRQEETNLHNIYTDTFELAYYTGAAMLLVVIAFFRDTIIRTLPHVRLSSLTPLLPSRWVLVPASLLMAFTIAGFASHILTLLTLVLTLFILIYVAMRAAKTGRFALALAVAIIPVFIVTSIIIYTHFPYVQTGVREWIASEYKEMFIALAFLIYSLDIVFNLPNELCLTKNKRQPRKPTAAKDSKMNQLRLKFLRYLTGSV